MDRAFVQGGLCWGMFRWANELSLAVEQSIGRSQEALVGRLYKVDFDGQVGFPLQMNIRCNFTNSQVGREVRKCYYPCCMWFGAAIILHGGHFGRSS